MKFVNPHDPSPAELREWACTPGAEEPCQDFDLILSWAWHDDTCIAFASDPACPSRDYFLAVLYLMVGDAVRTGFRNVEEAGVLAFVALADGSRSEVVREWQARSRQLLRDPDTFDYADWCGGGLARRRLR